MKERTIASGHVVEVIGTDDAIIDCIRSLANSSTQPADRMRQTLLAAVVADDAALPFVA